MLATLEFLAASGLKPTVSALHCGHGYLTDVGQRLRALVRQRRRHRDDQRHPDPRPPGPGLDHRHHDPPAADAAGHDEAAPDHLADDLPGRRQHARRCPTTTTTSTSASARCSAPTPKLGSQLSAVLKPSQWTKLIDRLGKIDNPTVPTSAVEVRARRPRRRARPPQRRDRVGLSAALPLRPVGVPLGARPAPTGATSSAATRASRRTSWCSPVRPPRRRARWRAGGAGARRRARSRRAPPAAVAHHARDADRRRGRSPRPATRSAGCDGADGEHEAASAIAALNRVLHAPPDRRPPTRRCARSPASRRSSSRVGYRRRRAGRRRPRGHGALELPRPARAGRAAAPRCARRSGSRRCSAAATPRWPARSSPCAPAPTSTPDADREAALQLEAALAAALAELAPLGAARRPRRARSPSCAALASPPPTRPRPPRSRAGSTTPRRPTSSASLGPRSRPRCGRAASSASTERTRRASTARDDSHQRVERRDERLRARRRRRRRASPRPGRRTASGPASRSRPRRPRRGVTPAAAATG